MDKARIGSFFSLRKKSLDLPLDLFSTCLGLGFGLNIGPPVQKAGALFVILLGSFSMLNRPDHHGPGSDYR